MSSQTSRCASLSQGILNSFLHSENIFMGSTNHSTPLTLRLMVRITSMGMRNIDINLLWQKEIAFEIFCY